MPRSKAAKKSVKEEKVVEKKEEKPDEEQEEEEEEQQVEKTKQIGKAKKYKKKTIDQIVRINKSKYERIFLLEAKRVVEEDHWAFSVQGVFYILFRPLDRNILSGFQQKSSVLVWISNLRKNRVNIYTLL